MDFLKNKFSEDEWKLVSHVRDIGKHENDTWYDLAVKYNIKSIGDREQRRKAANDVWRKYLRLNNNQENRVTEYKPEYKKPKRLFYDIETSYNIVKSWRIGYNINLNMEDIIQERAIITIAYKWADDDKVTVLIWNDGDDKLLISEFIEVMKEADELIGHNIDRFDTKFILGRALKHGIPALPKYQSTDTLKLAKKHFMLNSNKLDYIAQYLNIGHKLKHRGLPMWDDIILKGDRKALEEMVEYNVQDVFLTEKVYNKLMEYSLPKVNHSVEITGDKSSCPECGEHNANLIKTYVKSSGTKTRLMKCNCCETYFSINNTLYIKNYE